MEQTFGNKRSSIGSSESGATLKIAGLVKATPLVRLNVNASVSRARWSTPTSRKMTEKMKTDAPSTVVKSNTISEAPGPTIFVPMVCSWKKLVCDGSIPVGPEGNTNSTLEICPALAPNQRLLVDHTSKGNTEGDTSANKLPRLSELDPMVVVVLVSHTKGLPLESRTALVSIRA